MPLDNARIPYPDFKLYEVIDPEQFDANNSELVRVLNACIDMLNRVSDGSVVDNIAASAVSTDPVEPFVQTNVQAMLKALINTLYGDGSPVDPETGDPIPEGEVPTDPETGEPIPTTYGAELVKIKPITGLLAENVQRALEIIYDVIDDLGGTTGDTSLELGIHKTSSDHDGRYYTELEMDTRLEPLENGLPLKTDNTGDHKGTWQGMTIEQVTTYATGNPAFVEVLEEDPAFPFIGQMWMVVGGSA